MSAIKDGRFPIMLDRERHMLFSLNVLDEMQDKLGGYDKMGEALSGPDAMKKLKWLLALVINEGKEPDEDDLTEMEIGKMIHTGNIGEMRKALFAAFSQANGGDADEQDGEEVKEPDEAEDGENAEDEDDEEKNVMAGAVE